MVAETLRGRMVSPRRPQTSLCHRGRKDLSATIGYDQQLAITSTSTDEGLVNDGVLVTIKQNKESAAVTQVASA